MMRETEQLVEIALWAWVRHGGWGAFVVVVVVVGYAV